MDEMLRRRLMMQPKGGGLPSEFQQYDWIIGEANLPLPNLQAIDGMSFFFKFKVRSDADLPTTKNTTCILGSVDGNAQMMTYGAFTCGITVISEGVSCGLGTYSLPKDIVLGDPRGVTFEGYYDKSGCTVNNISKEFTITIRGENIYPCFTDSSQIYYLTVKNNGSIIYNGIPAMRKSSGACGFYDTISNTFLSASQWTCGND